MNEQHSRDWTACRYTGADEGTHEPGNEENYSESCYFNFFEPKSGVGAVYRIANRPTLGYAEMLLDMPLPDGGVAFRYGRDATESNAGFSAQGMEMWVGEPTRTWHMTYEGDVRLLSDPSGLGTSPGETLRNGSVTRCRIELQWTAKYPLHVLFAEDERDTSPGRNPAYGKGHYEQFGELTGEIAVGDNRWVIHRAPAFRDHSWGRREWEAFINNFTCAYLTNGIRISAVGALRDDGMWETHGGVIWDNEGLHHVSRYDVITDYAGEARYTGPYAIVVGADGTPAITLEGEVLAFVPLRSYSREGDRGVRIGQTLTRFESDCLTGWGWTELTRPMFRH